MSRKPGVCTCAHADSRHEGNPEGHSVGCPLWGSRAPNTWAERELASRPAGQATEAAPGLFVRPLGAPMPELHTRDPHLLRAAIELGKPLTEVTREERAAAKVRSFVQAFASRERAADTTWNVLEMLDGLLETMTPTERKRMHEQLFSPFCLHCFGPARDESGRACPCERDE